MEPKEPKPAPDAIAQTPRSEIDMAEREDAGEEGGLARFPPDELDDDADEEGPDRATIEQVGRFVVTLVGQWGERMEKVEASKLETTRLQVADNKEARTHAEALAQMQSQLTKEQLAIEKVRADKLAPESEHITALKDQQTRRENTVRWVSLAVIAGLFGFLITALALGVLKDPVAALPTLGLLIGFLYLLVRPKEKPPAQPSTQRRRA